jgi:hypothetical protein
VFESLWPKSKAFERCSYFLHAFSGIVWFTGVITLKVAGQRRAALLYAITY